MTAAPFLSRKTQVSSVRVSQNPKSDLVVPFAAIDPRRNDVLRMPIVFLTYPALRNRILFGSDYYMTKNERFEERLLSMNLRALLGEDVFWQIADINPRHYLS